MSAETLYSFRHALLRDAAYQLQLPGDRARLHGVAVHALEAMCGGRPPEPPPLDAADPHPFRPHPSDAWARELAWQAAHADPGTGVAPGVVTLYLRRAATLAERTYEDALRILREARDRRFEGIVCSNLARSRFRGGRRDEAEALSRRAVQLLRETGDRRSCGSALGTLANFCVELGRHADAERHWHEGLALARDTGDRRTEGVILGNLGAFHVERRRFEEAEPLLSHALEIHRSLGNRAFAASALGGLASLRALQHRRPEALSLWAEALVDLRAVGRPDILQGLESSMRRICRDAGLPPLDEPGA